MINIIAFARGQHLSVACDSVTACVIPSRKMNDSVTAFHKLSFTENKGAYNNVQHRFEDTILY